MRKIAFISKLVREGKIKLVAPSREVAESYSGKSKSSIRGAKVLLSVNLLEEATSLAYFGMYHKATSILYLVGIKCENHAATIILLKELFGIDNSAITFVKSERVDKQYYLDFSTTLEQVAELIELAESFIDRLSFFMDMGTEEEKKQYLSKFELTYFQTATKKD